MDKRRARFLLLAAGSAALLATSTVAAAAERDATPSEGERHCVVRLERIEPTSSAGRIAGERCYATFRDAIFAATQGKTVLPVDIGPAELTQSMLPPAGVTATVVIGIDFDNWHYDDSAGTKIWEASSGCSPSLGWFVENVGSAWNDRISSAKAYNSCNRYEHYELYNRQGSLIPCLPNCYEMGIMNDKTSSLWWKYS